MTPSRAEILTFAAQGSGIYGKPCGHISGRRMVCCSFLSRWRIRLLTQTACCTLLSALSVFASGIECISQQRSADWSRSLAQHKNETAGLRAPCRFRPVWWQLSFCSWPRLHLLICSPEFMVILGVLTPPSLQFAAETPFSRLAHAALVFPMTEAGAQAFAGQCFDLAVIFDDPVLRLAAPKRVVELANQPMPRTAGAGL